MMIPTTKLRIVRNTFRIRDGVVEYGNELQQWWEPHPGSLEYREGEWRAVPIVEAEAAPASVTTCETFQNDAAFGPNTAFTMLESEQMIKADIVAARDAYRSVLERIANDCPCDNDGMGCPCEAIAKTALRTEPVAPAGVIPAAPATQSDAFPALQGIKVDPVDLSNALHDAHSGLGQPPKFMPAERHCKACQDLLPSTTPLSTNLCERCAL